MSKLYLLVWTGWTMVVKVKKDVHAVRTAILGCITVWHDQLNRKNSDNKWEKIIKNSDYLTNILVNTCDTVAQVQVWVFDRSEILYL